MDREYKGKYIKYKAKYIELKKKLLQQKGGEVPTPYNNIYTDPATGISYSTTHVHAPAPVPAPAYVSTHGQVHGQIQGQVHGQIQGHVTNSTIPSPITGSYYPPVHTPSHVPIHPTVHALTRPTASTIPASTIPASTIPASMVPILTHPIVPASTIPASTVPALTRPTVSALTRPTVSTVHVPTVPVVSTHSTVPVSTISAMEDETGILPQYFIDSSHNTYIMANQLSGTVSYCMYMLHMNLIRGGCLEIDPNSIEGDDVAISHTIVQGAVMNSLRLSTILRTIRYWVEKNYVSMKGPIILSFDNKSLKKKNEHDVVWKVIKENLYYGDDYKSKPWYWPLTKPIVTGSAIKLSDLKGKILIKWDQCVAIEESKKGHLFGKCMRTTLLPQPISNSGEPISRSQSAISLDSDTSDESDAEFVDVDPSVVITEPLENYASGKGLTPPEILFPGVYSTIRIKGTNNKGKTRILTKYQVEAEKEKSLPQGESYSRWVHLGKTNYPIAKQILPPNVEGEMKSEPYEEKEFNDTEHTSPLIKNTMKNFIRVFPPAENMLSGNYNPTKAWANGCQMVALNIQTMDRFYFINREFFRNGPFRKKNIWFLKRGLIYPNNCSLKLTIISINGESAKYNDRLKIYSPQNNYSNPIARNDNIFILPNVNLTAPIVYIEICLDKDKGIALNTNMSKGESACMNTSRVTYKAAIEVNIPSQSYFDNGILKQEVLFPEIERKLINYIRQSGRLGGKYGDPYIHGMNICQDKPKEYPSITAEQLHSVYSNIVLTNALRKINIKFKYSWSS